MLLRMADEQLSYVFRGHFLLGLRLNKAIRTALLRIIASGKPLLRITVLQRKFHPSGRRLRFVQSLPGACFLLQTKGLVKAWQAKTKDLKLSFIHVNDPCLVLNHAGRLPACPPYGQLDLMLSEWTKADALLPARTNIKNLADVVWRLREQTYPEGDPSPVPSIVTAFQTLFRRIAQSITFASDEYLLSTMDLWDSLPDTPRWSVRSKVIIPPALMDHGSLLSLSRVAHKQPLLGCRILRNVLGFVGTHSFYGAHTAEILDNLRLVMSLTDMRFATFSEPSFVDTMTDCAKTDSTLRTLLVTGGWKELWADARRQELCPEAKNFLRALDTLDD